MAYDIPAALQSPRVDNQGIIHWYANDEFVLSIKITLNGTEDDEATPIVPATGDILYIEIIDSKGKVVGEATPPFSQILYASFLDITGSTFTIDLDFTDTITKLFIKDNYFYRLKYYDLSRDKLTTIAHNNIFMVE